MASVYEPEKLKELVSKGIVANVELDYMLDKLKSTPKYKCRELLAAKMQGKV